MKPIYRTLLAFVAVLALTYSSFAQTNWSQDILNYVSDIGNNSTQRPTIASVVLNNKIYIAYTSSNNCDGSGGCAIAIRAANVQYSDQTFNFGLPGYLSVPTLGLVFTKVNPAMGVQNGIVYMAWTDEGGNNRMSISTDMINWSGPLSIGTGSTIESINIAFNPSVTNQVWASYVSSTGYPVICYIYPNTSNFPASGSPTCYQSTNSGTQMLYNPALIWVNNLSYMFSTWHGSNHCLDEFYNTTGAAYDNWTYWNPNKLCNNQQTSSAPDPLLYNGNLYVAFRSNDSSANFNLVGGSISGTNYNWSRLTTGSHHMDGSPDLLPLSVSQGITLICPSELVNFYSYNNTLHSMYSCN